MENSGIKCLFVSTEVVPYAKTGGLADVAGALPNALRKIGIDVRVVMPYYSQIQGKFFDHDAHYLTNYDVHVDWKREGLGVYYNSDPVPTYLLKSDCYFGRDNLYGYDDDFERFAFFCKGVLELIKHIDFVPDIIHCNDWQTGPICLLLKEQYRYDARFSHIKTIFTIHNMKYQGVFGDYALRALGVSDDYKNPEQLEFNGGISYMKAGLIYADHVNTVSPSYANEIKTPEYGCGLDGLLREKLYYKLTGILNGIDYEKYNPSTDPYIYKHYSPDNLEPKKDNKEAFQREYGLEQRDAMMVGIISRITDQKGFDLMKQTIDGIWFMDKLMEMDIQFVVLGTGDYDYENMFKHFSYKYPSRSAVFLTFSEALAQKIYAACDVFLMPSAFEPCGLGQLIAMRYGAVPIVRKTGGLRDTVIHYNTLTKEGVGLEFEEYTGYWLYQKIREAYHYYKEEPWHFKQMQINAIKSVFSWESSAKSYREMYYNVRAGY